MTRNIGDELLRKLKLDPALLAIARDPRYLKVVQDWYKPGDPARFRNCYDHGRLAFIESWESVEAQRQALSGSHVLELLEQLSAALIEQNRTQMMLFEINQRISQFLTQRIPEMDAATLMKKVDALCEHLSSGTGLLVRRCEIFESASIRTRDYLAAEHYHKAGGLPAAALTSLTTDELRWHECARLYVGLNGPAAPIIEHAEKSRHPAAIDLINRVAELGQELDRPATATAVWVREKLHHYLESDEKSNRKRAGIAALRQLQRAAVPLTQPPSVDALSGFVTNGMYQAFVDVMVDESDGRYQDLHPDSWRGGRFPVGESDCYVRGIRPEHALLFVDWASKTLALNCRLPTLDELRSDPISDANLPPILAWCVGESEEPSLEASDDKTVDLLRKRLTVRSTLPLPQDFRHVFRCSLPNLLQRIIRDHKLMLNMLRSVHPFKGQDLQVFYQAMTLGRQMEADLNDLVNRALAPLPADTLALHYPRCLNRDVIAAKRWVQMLRWTRVEQELSDSKPDHRRALELCMDLHRSLTARCAADPNDELLRYELRLAELCCALGALIIADVESPLDPTKIYHRTLSYLTLLIETIGVAAQYVVRHESSLSVVWRKAHLWLLNRAAKTDSEALRWQPRHTEWIEATAFALRTQAQRVLHGEAAWEGLRIVFQVMRA